MGITMEAGIDLVKELELQSQEKMSIVPEGYVNNIWPVIEEILNRPKNKKAWQDLYTTESLRVLCSQGHFQLWVGFRGNEVFLVAFTALIQYPKGIYLRQLLMCGEGLYRHKDWLKATEDWAKTKGAIGGEVIGRKPWIRILAKFGYKEKSVLLTKNFIMYN